MIEIDHLTKVIQGREILGDITISLPETGLFAITGDNGSGKTVLLNVLGLLDRDYSGSFRWDGAELSKLDERKAAEIRASWISSVFQKDNLVTFLDKDENRSLDLLLRKKKFIDKDKKSYRKCSEGEKESCALERGLRKGKRLYLLDEITEHLDQINTEKTLRQVKELSKEALVLLVTHDERILSSCDHILTMEKGRLLSSPRGEKDRPAAIPSLGKLPSLSPRLLLRSQKASRVPSLFFSLLSFLSLVMAIFPWVGRYYDYSQMLPEDIRPGMSLRFDHQEDPVEKAFPDSGYPLCGSIVLDDSLPADGKIHMTQKAYDSMVWNKAGKDSFALRYSFFSFSVLIDDFLPFEAPFTNRGTLQELQASQLRGDFVLHYSQWICPAYSEEDLDTADDFDHLFRFITPESLKQSEGREAKEKTEDDVFYLLGDYDAGLLSEEPTHFPAYPEYSHQSPFFLDLNALFPNGVKVLRSEFPAKDFPSGYGHKALLSEKTLQKMLQAFPSSDSYLVHVTSENRRDICSAIYHYRLHPSWYLESSQYEQYWPKKSDYENLVRTADSLSAHLFVLSLTLGIYLFLAFLSYLTERLILYLNRGNIRIFYSQGLTPTRIFLLWYWPYPFEFLFCSVIGYFGSLKAWGVTDSNMFGFFPAPPFPVFLFLFGLFLLTSLIFYLTFRKKCDPNSR